jgi:hypothetical protein
MKKTLLIFLFSILFSSTALACNFKISNFGDKKEQVKLEGQENKPQPVLMPDQFGGESLLIPMEDICKEDKSLWGTLVIHLYIDNKLSQIQLYRANMKDNKLMDFAMRKYGKFNLPEGLPKNKWRGSYQWEVGNDYVQYVSANIHDGHAEVIEITSKLYANVIADYNSKVGKWLDSQK